MEVVRPPLGRGDEELPTEFEPGDLGNERLDDHLKSIANTFGRPSGASIPAACSDWAETRPSIGSDITKPWIQLRCSSLISTPTLIMLARGRELLVVSDTTNLTFPSHPAKEGLGDIGNSSVDVGGIKLRSTIGIDPNSTVMTGLLDQQVLLQEQGRQRNA